MKVFVCGLESSGTNWFRDVLNKHPQIEATSDSFPSGWGEDRHYPEIPADAEKVVVMMRDGTCHRKSVERRGYETGNEGRFTDEESVRAINGQVLERMPCDVVFVSYEGLMLYRYLYLYEIISRLGADWSLLTSNVEYIDGNAKYFEQ